MPNIKYLNAAGGVVDGHTIDYTTAAAWEDYADDQASADQWAECSGTGSLGALTMAGWTSTATALLYPRIYGAAGHRPTGFSNGVVFDGIAAATVGIVSNTGPEYVEFDGIRVTGAPITAGMLVRACTVKNCVIDGGGTGLSMSATGTAAAEILVQNCLIRAYDTLTATALGFRTSVAAKVAKVFNNTLISAGSAGVGLDTFGGSTTSHAALTIEVRNNVASAVTCYKKSQAVPTVTVTASNNASTDGTATSYLGGSNNLNSIVLANEFTNSGTGDYTLKTSGSLDFAGIATTNATSLNGVSRPSPPSIGAYEVPVPAVPSRMLLIGIG